MTYSLLTTIERVKRRGSMQTDGDDQLIDELIAELSADVEDFVGRHIVSTLRTEEHRMMAHEHIIPLPGWPIASVTSLKLHSRTGNWANVTALSTDLYEVDDDAGTIFIRTSVEQSPTWAQIVYTGGIVSSSGDDPVGITKNFVASFPHIAGAVDQEVLIRLQRRKMPNAGQIVHKGAMRQMPRDMGLLADTKRRLRFLKPVRVN